MIKLSRYIAYYLLNKGVLQSNKFLRSLLSFSYNRMPSVIVFSFISIVLIQILSAYENYSFLSTNFWVFFIVFSLLITSFVLLNRINYLIHRFTFEYKIIKVDHLYYMVEESALKVENIVSIGSIKDIDREEVQFKFIDPANEKYKKKINHPDYLEKYEEDGKAYLMRNHNGAYFTYFEDILSYPGKMVGSDIGNDK